MNTTKKTITVLGAVVTLLTFASPAFAAIPSTVASVITQSDIDVAARIIALETLNSQVQSMSNVSAAAKTSTSAEVASQITGLTALKSKIDADTDLTTARTDAQSVFTMFRIYALVIPQGYLLVSADRINTIGTLMTALATKLQGREAQATIAGGSNQTGAPAALADITKKITDADAHAALATNGILSLMPDNGNATIASTNKSALLVARGNIATATTDLTAAREDISMIINNLNISTTATQ